MSERKTILDNEWETSLSSSGSNSLGSFAINASVTSRVRHRAMYNTHCVHFRLLINGQQKWYSNHTFDGSGYYRFTTGLQTEIVNKAAAAQTVSIVVQVAETLLEQEPYPGRWDELASATITVPALSTSHYDFYNDEAMTDLYERIDVYEAQYLTVPSAIPSVAMSEWVDSNGITYQFGAQVQNTSMQEQTYKFRPVFPDIKAKVKVSGEWVDGDIKCKVNGEWVDANAVYVKVGGEWIEIS